MWDELRLLGLIRDVGPLDKAAMSAARRRQGELAKPPGSLGRLEDLSVQLAGITGKVVNVAPTTAWWRRASPWRPGPSRRPRR